MCLGIHVCIHFMYIITYPLVIMKTCIYTGGAGPGRHRRQGVSRTQDHRAGNGLIEHRFNLPLRSTRCGGIVCCGESL